MDVARLKAVVIEDDGASRTALRGLLRSLNVEVLGETSSGRHGLNLVRSVSPELVCLDIGLPDLNGSDVLEQVRANHPDARVVMITSTAEREKVRHALSQGALGYIVKPFSRGTLASTLRRLFPSHAIE